MTGSGFVDHSTISLAPPAGDGEKRSAALFVAGRATDADDLRELLDMLGLGKRPASAPGDEIRARRRSAGLSVAELAAQNGISRAHLSNIENGRRVVPGGFAVITERRSA